MPLDLSRFLRSRNPDDPRVRAARTRDVDRTIELCRALLTERGEVSGARVAAELLGAYQRLSEEEVEWFFDRLVTTFSVDAETVRQAAAAYRLDASPANLLALQEAVEPPRQELFRRCNMAPGGTAVLVEMRRRLLRTLGDHPHRAEIDADLTHLFPSATATAEAEPERIGRLGIVRQRVGALQALACEVAAVRIELHPAAPLQATLEALRALPGIGEWTVQLIAMRVLAWPDAFAATDIGVLNALGTRDVAQVQTQAEAWRPWRAYGVMGLWQTLEDR